MSESVREARAQWVLNLARKHPEMSYVDQIGGGRRLSA